MYCRRSLAPSRRCLIKTRSLAMALTNAVRSTPASITRNRSTLVCQCSSGSSRVARPRTSSKSSSSSSSSSFSSRQQLGWPRGQGSQNSRLKHAFLGAALPRHQVLKPALKAACYGTVQLDLTTCPPLAAPTCGGLVAGVRMARMCPCSGPWLTVEVSRPQCCAVRCASRRCKGHAGREARS